MVFDSSKPSRGADRDDVIFRQLSRGSIRHVTLESGTQIMGEDTPEIVVRIAGRGRLLWPGATPRERPASTLFLPPEAILTAHGHVRALRVVLNDLQARPPVGPIKEILVGLICERAWHSTEPVSDAALALVLRLIEEEAAAARKTNGNGRA